MTKLKTVKREANVGERILITSAIFTDGQYENGNVAEVSRVCDTFPETIVYVKEWSKPVHISEYRVFVEDYKTNARLTEAEAKIAELVTEVAALKLKAVEPSITLNGSFLPPLPGEVVRFRGVKASDFKKTPNQRRSNVIKRAQAFVADLEERAYDGDGEDGNSIFEFYTSRLTFHVNPEKRVVTALAHSSAGRLLDKAFAKCHPNDVFNADIGKAIATGKLYGVDIPQEFVDAPKPTEIVAYHIIETVYRGKRVVTPGDELEGGHRYRECGLGAPVSRNARIIDDSNAVYV